ncbi:MAG: hypothetical protein L0Z70_05610 [Chloroflexi bacterium]|nr:hypothetical protein [Chloroflexota bacterium]
MKYLASLLLVAFMVLSPFGAPLQHGAANAASPAYTGYPTFSIVSVVKDASVTIKVVNLPANDEFRVRMGKMGTRGVNGVKAGSFGSGDGSVETLTFDIPAELHGLKQISIRIESKTGSGYFAYNWFYNNPSGSTGGADTGGSTSGDYTGYPTFSIKDVVKDSKVTIRTSNLPPDDKFVVKMGKMGTRGVNGVKGVEFDTGAGGAQTFSFDIPADLHGLYQIAIRIESVTGSDYYAYNWFYNNTASASSGGSSGTGGAVSDYSGYPTFTISAVVRNQTVTIKIKNLPPDDEFRVRMGYYGTLGVGGYKVISLDTLAGGAQTHTFNIPAELKNQQKIAIRLESKTGSGYYAYNWFWNNTTP